MNVIRFRITITATLLAALALGACASADPEPSAAAAAPSAPLDARLASRRDQPYIMQHEARGLSAHEELAYLAELTDEEFATLVENARITEFVLTRLDAEKAAELMNVLPELGVLTLQNVHPFLTPRERSELEAYELGGSSATSTIDKSCSGWRAIGGSKTVYASFLCEVCVRERRECDWWDRRPETRSRCWHEIC